MSKQTVKANNNNVVGYDKENSIIENIINGNSEAWNLEELLKMPEIQFNNKHIAKLIKHSHFDIAFQIVKSGSYTSIADIQDIDCPIAAILNHSPFIHELSLNLMLSLITNGENINALSNTMSTVLTQLANQDSYYVDLSKSVLAAIIERINDIDNDLYGMSASLYIKTHLSDYKEESWQGKLNLEEVEVDSIYMHFRSFFKDVGSNTHSIEAKESTEFLRDKFGDGYKIPKEILVRIVNNKALMLFIVENAKDQPEYFIEMILQSARDTGSYSIVAKLILQGHEGLIPHMGDFLNGISIKDFAAGELEQLIDLLSASDQITQFIIRKDITDLDEVITSKLIKSGKIVFKEMPVLEVMNLGLQKLKAIQESAENIWNGCNKDLVCIADNDDIMFFQNAIMHIHSAVGPDYFNKMSSLIEFFEKMQEVDYISPLVSQLCDELIPQLQSAYKEARQVIDEADTCCLSLMGLIPHNISYNDYMNAMKVEFNEDGTFVINAEWKDADIKTVQQYIDVHEEYGLGEGILLLINNATDLELVDSLCHNPAIYVGIKQMQKSYMLSEVIGDRVDKLLENGSFSKILEIDTGDKATDDLIKSLLAFDELNLEENNTSDITPSGESPVIEELE